MMLEVSAIDLSLAVDIHAGYYSLTGDMDLFTVLVECGIITVFVLGGSLRFLRLSSQVRVEESKDSLPTFADGIAPV